MGFLTTHVLDTARGCPGANIKIELFRLKGDAREKIAEAITNEDGRTDSPILAKESFATGVYELVFHAGSYLDAQASAKEQIAGLTEPKFLDIVPIRFGISEADQHYHVPLLLSPYGYSTYRGS